MSRELVHLVEQIGREKGIETETLIDAISAAIVSASRRHLGQVENIKADIDMETGEISLSLIKEVVEEVEEPEYQLTQEDAKEFDPEAAVGDQISIPVDVDVSGLGRIAAQTAKQVIVQRVREAEREMIYNEYKDREGDLIMGIVQRYEKGNYIIDLGKAEALLPYREQSFREQLHRGDRLRAYVLEVRSTSRGPQIILSRTHPGLLIKLFELEVPEVYEGIVEIVEAVREPSGRAKIAVISKDRDVDPVGACVGVRGSRVQAIVQELRGEKIDIIKWSEDPEVFVTNALSPAKIANIFLHKDENRMEVIVPEDQLSLAIGKKGQNVRLAAKLTHYKIDIKGEEDHKREKDEIAIAAAEAVLGTRKRVGVPLIEQIPGVGGKTAELLGEAAFSSVEAVASAALEELMAVPGIGKKKAESIRNSAIEILEEVSQSDSTSVVSPEADAQPSLAPETSSTEEVEGDQRPVETALTEEELKESEPLDEAEELIPPSTDSLEELAEDILPDQDPDADKEGQESSDGG
ncbi:MAG: transcription termination/antitermination protein NusA [Nitrospinae bacterium]|nr:transcription termination/antitermination protein NusA [Nitrospinota bacterium]